MDIYQNVRDTRRGASPVAQSREHLLDRCRGVGPVLHHRVGLERIDTYTFGFPTQYLRLGDLQLHIFQRDQTEAPPFHHIALNVDDLEAAWLRAQELGVLDTTAFFSPIYELPDGTVQVYLRDPGNNLVELDWPDADTLDRSVFGEIPKLADSVAQTEEGMRATLYLSS